MSFYPDKHHPVYFLVDSLNAIGVNTEFAKDERTLGCWGMVFPDYDNRILVYLIDNRHVHEAAKEDPAAKELLAQGAIAAHAQRPDYERIGGHWLPLAASPFFSPVNVAKTATAAFVGYVRDEGRARLLSDIGSRFRLNIAQGVFGKQAVETYCSALCGVNIVTRSGDPTSYDSWNMRAPEIMACGIPLITEYQPYLNDLGLIAGHNVLLYRDSDSLLECLEFVEKNPEVAAEIGRAGRELILERHTYKHRAERIKQWLSA